MEVIIRNLPDQITDKQIEKYFKSVLEKLSITTYHCQKLRGRGCARLTILDIGRAQRFLELHGQTQSGQKGFHSVQQKLFYMRRPVNCSRSNNVPDQFLLQSLKKEEKDRYAASQSRKPKIVPLVEAGTLRRAFDISQLKCGQWAYVQTDVAFATYYQERRKGRIIFGHRSILIKLDSQTQDAALQQVEIPYESIESFTMGPTSDPCMTFSLHHPPKLFEMLNTQNEESGIMSLSIRLQYLAIQPANQENEGFTRKRIAALSKSHETVVSSCFCYRLLLSNSTDVKRVAKLKRFPEIPDSVFWDTSAFMQAPFATQMTALNNALTGTRYSNLPFELKFQIKKLAQNGILGPSTVVDLLVGVARLYERNKDVATTTQSVRTLLTQIPFPKPGVEASNFSLNRLFDLLEQNEESILREDLYFSRPTTGYDHIAAVHKVMVTPTGIRLYGPEDEVKNRILRKYSAFPTHFLSVAFVDEDGESLRFDRKTSGEEIYHHRFKGVLEGVINIAGRPYEFLGFSHSSLRSQTCWFMAPFTLDGSLVYAKSVIAGLGDFSHISCPAKCAARIGQTMSQTSCSISISPENCETIPDVERNGRTFSDGVGTCSWDILEKIWDGYAQARGLKPTVLQIRFQGAKGVISLDTRLQGSILRLRKSMIKFGCKNVADIEICGSAMKPLPMYLNRQLIKILEDLHVPDDAFLTLQAIAVENLRMTTLSAVNAASFFQRNRIGASARLPWLIRKLWALGYLFSDDDFLRNTMEIAVLVQLRELKHRSRIRVEKGVTVYGIMDETGYLQEGEVYCFVQTEEGGQLVSGSVVVTRCPALHPGDVQCVIAVDVPADSPLSALHNVVVFSSMGERDLPSQLSGGDLDGDLYNIIYDNTLYPGRLARPADYPAATPLDIGRAVERSDMTDFFISFMENDNLGLIATLHQILADQSVLGTLDPDCLLLANLHSTAVDFSKTGIPVNFKQLPRWPKYRPDFQAAGPRVLIEKDINFEEVDSTRHPEEDEEVEEVASYSPPMPRYYESPKILGKLYREIDEQKFFEELQRQSRLSVLHPNKARSLAGAVWNYVRGKTANFQWHHYAQFAHDVKESYEENLIETMLQYSTHRPHLLSEVEVFSGSILGKNGAQSKRQREASVEMKDKHDRDVAWTVLCITRGEDGDSGEEALERSIACLNVACNTERVRKKVGTLVSFVWIAAAVCLREVERMPGGETLH